MERNPKTWTCIYLDCWEAEDLGSVSPFFLWKVISFYLHPESISKGENRTEAATWHAASKMLVNPALGVGVACPRALWVPRAPFLTQTLTLSSDLCSCVYIFLPLDHCRYHPHMFGTQVHDEGRPLSYWKPLTTDFPFLVSGKLKYNFCLCPRCFWTQWEALWWPMTAMPFFERCDWLFIMISHLYKGSRKMYWWWLVP